MTVNYCGILTLEIIEFSYHGNLPLKITAIVYNTGPRVYEKHCYPE
jgi:hypothetical protein